MMERRSLLDGDEPITGEGSLDVFADEFEADDFDGIADGFRPHDDDPDEDREHDHSHGVAEVQRTMSTRAVSTQYAPDTTWQSGSVLQPRTSISKSRRYDDPFASPEDSEAEPTLTFEPGHSVQRSLSSASSHIFARTGSPRLTSGPSHPYGMYPQSTLARTASVATTSTMRVPPTPTADLRSGPQHPYALYPQGVEEDDEDLMPENPGTVGFPGLGQGYQRQVGPDGEEQDIIGVDGHAEQLPPYSRYPEDGAEKMPLLGVPTAPAPLRSRAPVAGTDPGMPLMHQTLQPSPTPQPQSMTDESVLVRQETRQSSILTMTATDSVASKKSWKAKSWTEKRKTRFCGIPLWWYILGGSVIGFIAAVLGGVLGGFLLGANRHAQQWSPLELYDASIIATPTGPLPATGTYALSLSTAQATQADCLTSSNQQVAWDCDLAGSDPSVAIVVEWNVTTNALGASLMYASNNTQVSYGTQSSWMGVPFTNLSAALDNNDVDGGPAYFFEAIYDKLVILPESALSATSSSKKKTKRQALVLDNSWLTQKTIARPGDKPWFCVWNNTLIEGFIYIQDSVSSSVSSSTSTMPSSSTSAPVATTATATITATDTITTTLALSYTTATYIGVSQSYSPWYSSIAAAGNNQEAEVAPAAHSPEKRGDTTVYTTTTETDLYASLSLYPLVVKLEERRVSGNTVTPYCQQYQILDDGSYGPVTDPNTGDMVVVTLEEEDPVYSDYQSAGIAGSKRRMRMHHKRDIPYSCHCQWMSEL